MRAARSESLISRTVAAFNMAAAQPNEILINFWLVTWIACGIAGCALTTKRTGKGALGFWLGLLLGPLGLLICFFVGSERDKADNLLAQGARKKCPMCAELVQPEALLCKHCGHRFGEAEV